MHLILTVYLLIYYLSQPRYLYGGDSTEYSLISQVWGLGHPPGYPLYSLLSNIFTHFIPFIPVYARVNLLSILPTIATGYLIYLICLNYTKNRLASILSASFYLSLFTIWLYGSVPEVFALNNFFIALITWLVIRYTKNPKNNVTKNLLFFVGGLAIAHHHTFILFVPGWIILLGENPLNFLKKNLFKNILFLSLGFAFYLYAPVVSVMGSRFDWENAKTLEGFWRMITRSSYGTFSSYLGSMPSLFNQITGFLSTFVYIIKNFKPFGIALFAFGLFNMKRVERKFSSFIFVSLTIYLVFLFITNFPLIDNFSTATYERYLIAFYFLMAFPFAFGINALTKIKIYSDKISRLVPTLVYGYIILSVVLVFYASYGKISNLKHIDGFETYAKDVLATPEKKAIIAMSSDTGYFTVAYYHYYKNMRPDLKMVFPNILSRDYFAKRVKAEFPDLIVAENAKEFIVKNGAEQPLFFEKSVEVKDGYWVPYGLLWKYYQSVDEIDKDVDKIIKINDEFWLKKYGIPEVTRTNKDFLYYKALQDNYLSHWSKYIYFLITQGKKEKALSQLRLLLSQHNPEFEEARALIIDTLVKDRKCKEAAIFLPKTNKELWGSYVLYNQVCR